MLYKAIAEKREQPQNEVRHCKAADGLRADAENENAVAGVGARNGAIPNGSQQRTDAQNRVRTTPLARHITLAEIARALGGKVTGQQVVAPGPGHSDRDRSLSVRLSVASPDGFVAHSHAGDDWRVCRDHVASALGFPADRWRRVCDEDPAASQRRKEVRHRVEEQHRAETLRRQRQALAMWQDGRDPRGTVVEAYLRSRGLILPAEIAGEALRFHPRCPWEAGTAPAMVAALRCIRTGEVLGVHRTALSPDGQKLGRRMFGTAAGTAIMLDPEEIVSVGLTIGEGIETCLAARQLGLTPVWALGSVGAIGAFPVLPGIETLSVLAENDAGASARACQEVGTRWHRADRLVDIIKPRVGTDMNDVLREGSAACR
ncbi:hypothetical protein MOX02_40700 [Methylobacterium oxalidis]|uniref:Uncharacterized protein n=1 Tax=Methylobacterium oxalidis TaxID=944322 RepID=A0A512J801_9HYPH|nr:toprim domain-containing protein [Methylobacterium oxalidis]GEP06032.1 hypothetical protein MOX02_40700 [Methylobacterium oxalidis]GLS65751.1 hypothetical protein GCM10007888_41330 [Methylobacterium oxalidis]